MSALSEFVVTGPAAAGRARGAGLIDLLAAAVAAMIVFPQPIVRAAIVGAGLPIAVFVLLLLATVLAVFWLYLAFSVVAWGRSAGMYLFDLGLARGEKPTPLQAVGWASGWVLAVLPAVVGVRAAYDPEQGWPARLGGVPTRSTAPTAE